MPTNFNSFLDSVHFAVLNATVCPHSITKLTTVYVVCEHKEQYHIQ